MKLHSKPVNKQNTWSRVSPSHLVHDQLPLLQVAPGLPDQRSLRSAPGGSGYWCSAAAVDFRCHRDWDCREHPSCAAGGCYGLVRSVRNEASDSERAQRRREVQNKRGKVYFIVNDSELSVGRHTVWPLCFVFFLRGAATEVCDIKGWQTLYSSLQRFSRQPSSCLRQVGCGLVARYVSKYIIMLSSSGSVKGSQLDSQARRKRQSVLQRRSTLVILFRSQMLTG